MGGDCAGGRGGVNMNQRKKGLSTEISKVRKESQVGGVQVAI